MILEGQIKLYIFADLLESQARLAEKRNISGDSQLWWFTMRWGTPGKVAVVSAIAQNIVGKQLSSFLLRSKAACPPKR